MAVKLKYEDLNREEQGNVDGALLEIARRLLEEQVAVEQVDLADALHALVVSGVTLTGAESDFIDRALSHFEALGTLGDPLSYSNAEAFGQELTEAEFARERARQILQNRSDQLLELLGESWLRGSQRRADLGGGCDLPLPF